MTEEKIQVVEKRDVNLLLVSVCMLAVSALLQVVGIVEVVRGSSQVARDAAIAVETHKGVCLFRKNLQDQIRSTDRFLILHPQGIPGVPLVQIRQAEDRQKATVSALSDLQCSPQEEK